MAGAPERIEINTAVAVRGDIGFFFGTLRWIEPKRLLIEVDAELESGEEVDVRITLSPTAHTALLTAVIARPLVTARGELPRYVLDIVRIAADERALLDDWMANVKSRGTFSRFDTVVSSHRSAGEGAQANAEVRQALERLSRKPAGGVPGPNTDPFGVRSDLVTGSEIGAGRGAVRNALRDAIARNATRAAAPGTTAAPGSPVPTHRPPPAGPSSSPPSRPPGSTPPLSSPPSRPPVSTPPLSSPPSRPPVSTPPSSSPGFRMVEPSPPSVPPDEPYGARPGPGRVVAIGGTNPGFPNPAGTRPGLDPTYALAQTRTASWMEVRWQSAAAFDRDARLQLLNYILVLQRGKEPLPDKEPLRVMVRHEDIQLECAAQVKAHSATSATYRLTLDALQIERLRQWTLDYGRK